MAFMLFLSLVPILALVIQNGTNLNEVLVLQEELILVEKSVEVTFHITHIFNRIASYR